jgi:hypothetical protein
VHRRLAAHVDVAARLLTCLAAVAAPIQTAEFFEAVATSGRRFALICNGFALKMN